MNFSKAKEHLAVWEDGVKKSFLSADLNSTGGAGQFILG